LKGGDPSSEFDSQVAKLAPRAQAWLRAHPETFGTAKLGRIHWQAIEAGHQEGSDAYFQHLDTEFGFRRKPQTKQEEPEDEPEVETVEEDEGDEADAPQARQTQRPVQQAQQRKAAVAAPASREGTRISGTKKAIRLTLAQQQTADALGQTYEQYHKNLLIAQSRNRQTGR